MAPKAHPAPAVSDSAVVTKAAIRAAEKLDIKNKALGRIIGVSQSTVSRMKQGDRPLAPTQKPFELAVLFLRLYRSLDTMTGGDDALAASWLVNDNSALSGKPLELIQTVSGLGNVIQYLEAGRHR
ncbi:MAG TPA: MbcA/ParS/Xre antitoxin family protein [Pseudolabrys sp.]|nr:MbcA/ParS/Xre antitoxin family protein [Pseudolabrys sp.]